jgi:hypothetical protein
MRIVLPLAALACACAFAEAPETFANPCPKGSIQPNWSVTPDGKAVLSWVEASKNGLYTLRYAIRGASAWSEPHTVAADRHFFRHPAEVPEVIAINDHQWMAHWIETPKEESEAEFVYVSSSNDGAHWTAPIIAHKDRSQVEHGLAAMAVSGAGEVSIMWLELLKGEDGPASLKRTVVNASGQVVKEEQLDNDVCSCCPTAIARTAKGLLVAYRDHTKDDIRDIAAVRYENGKWSPSKIVHADNWKLNACPINAAAVAANGDHAAIAWYTGAQDAPKVQVVFSNDGGATFSQPVVVSTGRALGYTSIALEGDGSATISWLEQGEGGNTRVLYRTVPATGTPGPVVQVASGARSALGYPKVTHAANETLIAWGDPKQIQTARIKK